MGHASMPDPRLSDSFNEHCRGPGQDSARCAAARRPARSSGAAGGVAIIRGATPAEESPDSGNAIALS